MEFIEIRIDHEDVHNVAIKMGHTLTTDEINYILEDIQDNFIIERGVSAELIQIAVVGIISARTTSITLSCEELNLITEALKSNRADEASSYKIYDIDVIIRKIDNAKETAWK